MLKLPLPLLAAFGFGALGCSGDDSGASNTQATATSGSGGSSTAASTGQVSSSQASVTGGEPALELSFFVTSYDALAELSGSPFGFGGDLGGLAGADDICQTIAASVGAGDKTWRAFLSATDDGSGQAVNAIERIGNGPWYDANGRKIADDPSELTAADRPKGDSAGDLPDEHGRSLESLAQGHDILTGSTKQGFLSSTDPESTCLDWTTSDPDVGNDAPNSPGPVMAGHAWPSPTNANWISSHGVTGCAPGYQFGENSTMSATPESCVGCAGGYGGLYCFALDD